jgi:Protein of unknown function (DUF2934)
MPNEPHTDSPEREQRIRERAYQLWQADGAPEGKSDNYWYRARELLEAESEGVRGRS